MFEMDYLRVEVTGKLRLGVPQHSDIQHVERAKTPQLCSIRSMASVKCVQDGLMLVGDSKRLKIRFGHETLEQAKDKISELCPRIKIPT